MKGINTLAMDSTLPLDLVHQKASHRVQVW